MKQKWLTLCLAAALAAALAGCGKGGPAQSAQPTVDPQEVQQQQDEFDPRGIVLVDEGGLKITVGDLRQMDFGIDVDLELENTSLQDLSVSAASSSVNGYMTGVYFFCQVPAQDTAQDTASIYMDELSELGVTDLADLAISFTVDSQEGSGYSRTAPRSVTTPLAALYDYAASPLQSAMADPDWAQDNGYRVLCSATDLYDQDGVSLLSAFLVEDAFGVRQLRLELENSSLERAAVKVGNITLNGTALSGDNYGTYSIEAGKRYLSPIILDSLAASADPQGDYSQLREVGLCVNGTPIRLPIPQ